jgi:P-type Cu+ transporter
LRMAASIEHASEHPLAAAIVAGATDRGIALASATDFASITGMGVSANVDGRVVGVGSERILSESANQHRASSAEATASAHGAPSPSAPVPAPEPAPAPAPAAATAGALIARAEVLRREAQTVMFVTIDGHPAGLIGVADPIKRSTPAALAQLRADGVRVVMLTGDSRATADAVARQLGIDEVAAEVMPQDKADVVKRMQAEGRVVAMAGDGINDAPALAQATVGIAMGTGTDVAIQSADITLVKGDLMGIVRARNLSCATMRNIRQNLFFAFIYNVLGVPIAAGVLYPPFGLLLNPMIASAAMSASSISVIVNSLRLRKADL